MTPIVGEILGPELLIVIGIIVLLFGGAKIPQLARSLGQATKEFRKGVAEGADPDAEPHGHGRDNT
jgi:sec-independent protein translocase protein TatA